MTDVRRTRSACQNACLFLCLSLLPAAALAGGPGTHCRESERTLDLLIAAGEAEWIEAANVPFARSWLHLGAVIPDFGQVSDELGFGHQRTLSYALLDAAVPLGPEWRLVALGHLSHQATDASIEGFVVGTLIGSTPLGMIDVAAGYEDAKGESEGIVETFGDLIIGRWHDLVDTLYDFWFDGPEARARGMAVLEWYCATARASGWPETDCTKAVADVTGRIDELSGYLSSFTREQAHEFVESFVSQPIPDLLDLMGSPLLDVFAGSMGAEKSPYWKQDVERLKASAVGTPEFWAQYDELLADLGPTWTIAFLAGRLQGWPAWNPNAMIAGNVESVMSFLPQSYAVRRGLLVDDVRWVDASGNVVKSVSASGGATGLSAKVRFFSALPFEGRVTGRVRIDAPGLDPAGDSVVGSAGVDVSIDPLAYASTPRIELSIPFDADPSGAVGFYLELLVDESPLPAFTTNWDRLWTIPDLDMNRRDYRDNFGTYGHWPPSLPVDVPVDESAALFVKVRRAPAGSGVADAIVEPASGLSSLTAKNGIAWFDGLAAGPYEVFVTPPAGFALPDAPSAADLVVRETRWIEVPVHPIPSVSLPSGWLSDPAGADVRFDPAPFEDQARTFLARAVRTDGGVVTAAGPEADVGLTGEGRIVLDPPLVDGDAFAVEVVARYVDETAGVPGTGAPVRVDTSAPAVVSVTAAEAGNPACVDEVPYGPAVDVAVEVDEPHAPVRTVRARLGGGEWTDVAWTIEAASPGRFVVRFPLDRTAAAPEAGLRVAIGNEAGLVSESGPTALSVWGAERLCEPEATSDTLSPDASVVASEEVMSDSGGTADAATVQDSADTEADAAVDVPDATAKKGGGGCAAGARGRNPAGGPIALAAFAIFAALQLRRRMRPASSGHSAASASQSPSS